ncbi:hypothetical protein GOODEAATRI_032740 [Goodea atripinnis]|uniref:Uncharacterized protein n=1 Tax=Goodea atripinnis TaxID=208336 RepID=A0ABV0NSI6_9TELE
MSKSNKSISKNSSICTGSNTRKVNCPKKTMLFVLVVFTGTADSETPRRPSPQTPPPAPPGGAQGDARAAEIHSPSSVSWAILWASSRWDLPGTPPEEGLQEASGIDARATSTGSSQCGGAAALLRAPSR